MASFAMLVSWEKWKGEKHAGVPKSSNDFDHACLPNKREGRALVLSGGKSIVPRE
jgi:hypothetical protein